MDYNSIIMDLLEQRGLDKRFRENPEAVRQICELIFEDIKRPINDIESFKKVVTLILDRKDSVDLKGNIYENNFFISKDGSLTFLRKTNNDKIVKEDDISRTNVSKSFFMRDDGGFLLQEIQTNFSQSVNKNYSDASKKLVFRKFNANGLEMEYSKYHQFFTLEETRGIGSYSDIVSQLFQIYDNKAKGKIYPIEKHIIARTSNLVEAYHIIDEAKGSLFIGNDTSNMIYEAKQGIMDILESKKALERGTIINYPIKGKEQLLYACSKYELRNEGPANSDKRRKMFDRLIEHPEFRKTLYEEAINNTELQDIIKRLESNIIGAEEYERIYNTTTAVERRRIMEELLAEINSKGENENKEI